jgi:hypothetical protein
MPVCRLKVLEKCLWSWNPALEAISLIHEISSFYFRLTRLRQLKILALDLLKTNTYQEPPKMANQPQSTSRRLLMLLVFALSFIAAYFLVRYLIR